MWGVVAHTRVQLGAQGAGVEAGPDEHELGRPRGAGRPRLGVEAEEPADGVHGVPVAHVVGAEVDVPLDAVEPGGPAVEEGDEAAGVERALGHEGEGVVARVQMSVLLLLGGVVPMEVVEGQLPDALLARPAVEEELGVDPAVRGGHHSGAVDEVPNRLQHRFRVVHPVDLVDDHEVGERQMPVDAGVRGPGLVELGGVHDLDEAAVDDVRQLTGEDHADELLRFGQAARLDDDDVDAGGGAGEPLEVVVELTGVDGTAETAVAEGHGRVAEGARDRHGVDLDGAEVVHDRADTAAAAAVEEVVEQGGLSRAEESGQHDHRNLPPAAPLRHTIPLTPVRTPAR